MTSEWGHLREPVRISYNTISGLCGHVTFRLVGASSGPWITPWKVGSPSPMNKIAWIICLFWDAMILFLGISTRVESPQAKRTWSFNWTCPLFCVLRRCNLSFPCLFLSEAGQNSNVLSGLPYSSSKVLPLCTCSLYATVWPPRCLNSRPILFFSSSSFSRMFLRVIVCLTWDVVILNSTEFVLQAV